MRKVITCSGLSFMARQCNFVYMCLRLNSRVVGLACSPDLKKSKEQVRGALTHGQQATDGNNSAMSLCLKLNHHVQVIDFHINSPCRAICILDVSYVL